MKLFERVKAAASLLVNGITHPKTTGYYWNLPSTKVDYAAKVGDGLGSNVIMSPILWVARAYNESRIGVQTITGKTKDLDLAGDFAQLMRAPNPHYSGSNLWVATLISWFLNGNAYWIKARNGAGQVKQLWYTPHWMIEPKWEGEDFISYYSYNPGGAGEQRLAPSEVVHMRHGLDPRNVRKGLAPLGSLLREIFNDDEAANFVAGLLANHGVPGVVISPKDGSSGQSDEDLKAVKNYIADNFSGDKRGAPLALGSATDIKEFGFDPQKMNLDAVRNVSEERVCAIIGLPAAVVGFGTGLEQTTVGATLLELHRIAWTNCVIPNQDLMAAELARALLPDFKPQKNQDVAWDRREVRALEDDQNKKAERLTRLVGGGVMKRAEAREQLGLDVLPEDDVYLLPFNVVETGPGAPPEPDPVPAPIPGIPAGGKGLKRFRLSRMQQRIVSASAKLRYKAQKRFEAKLMEFFKRYGDAAATAYKTYFKSPEDDLRVELIFHAMTVQRYEAELRDIFAEQYVAVHNENMGLLANLNVGVDLPDTAQLQILATGGERSKLVNLTNAAKQRALDVILAGREAGEGPDEIAAKLRDVVPAGPWTSSAIRAEITARTEVRIAQTESSVLAYRTVDGIDSVVMIDARLGPTDEECEAMDGQPASFDEALRLIRAEHPNGTRDMVPAFGRPGGQ